jgi:hypothetical protein
MHQIHSKDAGNTKCGDSRKERGFTESSLEAILIVLSKVPSRKQQLEVIFICRANILSEVL